MARRAVEGLDRPQRATVTRRAWLLGAFAGAWGLAARAAGPDQDSDEASEIRALAQRARMGRLRSLRSEHYLVIGDASDAHRKEALRICETLAADYQKHFQDKGFDITLPGRRLTVVALVSPKSYAAFVGKDEGPVVGGHFDVDTNRLVIFDFRSGDAEPVAGARRINTFALVHEAMHQLTFNTGLLDRRGDVPVALSEGLATYGELWSRVSRSMLGQVNKPRVQALREQQGQQLDWIPLRTLLTDDDLFQGAATEQLAYAQAWVLVHTLMKRPEKFREYLTVLRGRKDPARRLGDAEAHLGRLDSLDREVKRAADRFIRGDV